MKPKLLVFIFGLIVGLLIALVVPPLLNTVLPEGLLRGAGGTTGQVVAKRLQEDRLLLTIESGDGAVLATFTQRVPEIDLLVEEGDRVTLGSTSYEPFVEDPKILGVNKGAGEAEPEGVPEERLEPVPPVEAAPQPQPDPASESPLPEEEGGPETASDQGDAPQEDTQASSEEPEQTSEDEEQPEEPPAGQEDDPPPAADESGS